MSYIKCKSFVTGKDVQYGLIDVELKHLIKNMDITVNAESSATYWNTAPASIATYPYILRPSTGKWGTEGSYDDLLIVKGLTGRKEQAYQASGVLISNYTYVDKGPNPIISRQVINIDKLEDGINTFDLFETTNNKITLEVIKAKRKDTEFGYYADSYYELDGTKVENPYIIPSIRIIQVLKEKNIQISCIDLLQIDRTAYCLPRIFTINTELFRIKNFNPQYATDYIYNDRYSMYTDYRSKINNNLYTEGSITTESGDFIGMTFSLLTYDFWQRSNYSGTADVVRNKIVNIDGSDISNKDMMNINTNTFKNWILHNIEVNPTVFINFNKNEDYARWDTSNDFIDFAYIYLDSVNKYKIINRQGESQYIFGSRNFMITPIIIPYVNSEYMNSDSVDNGIYIPLTSTVFEGDPEPPEPEPPEPEPETTEPADDPATSYTPGLPSDVTPGYEEYTYEGGDVVNGDTQGLGGYRPNYSNYIFRTYYKDTDAFTVDAAWEIVNDCTNASMSQPFMTLYKLQTGHPQLSELISRIYELPFEYSKMFEEAELASKYAIGYGYAGIVTMDFGDKDHEGNRNDIHYYKRYPNRFKRLVFGTITVNRVFDNYLDFTDTAYTLNLPYGAGQVDVDPNMLFDKRTNTGTINIYGFLDFDTGFLVMKVDINNQLYYETTVNVAMDRMATMGESMAFNTTIGKMIVNSALFAGGIAGGGGIMSQIALRASDTPAREEARKQREESKDADMQRKINIDNVRTSNRAGMEVLKTMLWFIRNGKRRGGGDGPLGIGGE